MTIRIEASEYRVCGLPDDDVNSQVWRLTIEWRGPGDSWAICRIGYCLKTNGEWSYEPSPSNRSASFIRHHRFTLTDAMVRVHEEYPKLVINGLRVENGKLVPA